MKLIPVIQIVVSVILVALILLQERSAGMSGILGGGDQGGVYQTRRGLERIIFYATIVLALAFAGLAVAQLLIVQA
jgi:preprotein translocase subunit SecG